jgi:MFS family permease
VRRLLLLSSAIVFFDTLFFAVLTPLLPHYANTLGLGKTGAGVLAAAYPAGALAGAVPSGIVTARAGPKLTVIVGLTIVAVCTVLFGLASQPWQLDSARFAQGVASAFSWTGAMAWLVSASPPGKRGTLIGTAFATAVAGALFGPVLGGLASVAGVGVTFTTVGVLSLGLVAWAAATPGEPPAPGETQGPAALFGALSDRRMLAGYWLIVLPSLLFGTLSVLAPLRLAALGFGAVAIGATFLCSAALEAVQNVVLGRLSDRIGPLRPLLAGLGASAVVACLLPLPDRKLVLAVLVVLAGISFGMLFTPAMTLLANRSEERGLGYGYTFALINLAWAPGQAIGAAGGGALAHASADAVPYVALASVCLATLAVVRRPLASPA